MKAVITGGAGFIGSHTVSCFLASGAQVFVIDDLSHGRAENVPEGVVLYKTDVRDAAEINRIFIKEKPDVLVHLAAQISVPVSVREPAADAAVNIQGTVNCLEACRNNGTNRVVLASSAAVYGEPRTLPLTEDCPTSPLSFYGLSKLTAEGYLALYQELFGLSCCVLRYANVYGPGQDPAGEGGVVAVFHDRMKQGQIPAIHGDGGQTRDFVFVKDVARANYTAAVSDATGVYNVGTGLPVSVLELFNTMAKVFNVDAVPAFAPPRTGDIRDSRLSPGKIAKHMKWTAEYNLERGLGEL